MSDLVEATSVAIFHAHPDDEAFATAVASQHFAAMGAEVHLFVATGGEMGERAARPELGVSEARAARETRLDASCSLLGVSDWRYLTRAGEWLDDPDPSVTLAAAPPDALAEAVRRVIDEVRPDVVLAVGPDGLTGHPDHVAMYRGVVEALRRPGWKPKHAWGSVVRAADVAAAVQVLAGLGAAPSSEGGVDRVTGVEDELIDWTLTVDEAAQARRLAMDWYHPGLGTTSLEALVEQGLRGGSLVLRAVHDVAGASTEHFVTLLP